MKNTDTIKKDTIVYSLAFLVPIISFLLLYYFFPYATRAIPALFFFPTVALCAWYGGYKSGIASTIFSLLLIFYALTLLDPSFVIDPMHMILQMIVFLVEGVLVSILFQEGKRMDRFLLHKKREAELTQRVALLEKEHEEAKKEIRSRDEFLSIASHELKTPLTSMLLQTQTALHNIRNVSLAHFSIESLLKMLESVEKQTKRLSKMINDLLNVSLITTGNMQLEKEDVDLITIVGDVLEDFSERIHRDNYKIVLEGEESLMGYWDKVRIEQAIANLVSNALKYGDGQQIDIITKRKSKVAQVTIVDRGIGMTKEQQKKIFGLYERGVNSEQYKGLGVGLYITHKIIKAHGGIIMVSSKLGQGTTFIIDLPFEHNEHEKSGKPEAIRGTIRP